MKVDVNTHVTLEFRLYDAETETCLDETTTVSDPMSFVVGYGMVVPGLEEALTGMSPGEGKRIALEASEAFGTHDEDLVFQIARSQIPDDITPRPGDELEIELEDGDGPDSFVIIDVTDEHVVLDANHPLAGRAVVYEAKVLSVREATLDEIRAAAEVFEAVRDAYEATEHAGLVPLRRSKDN